VSLIRGAETFGRHAVIGCVEKDTGKVINRDNYDPDIVENLILRENDPAEPEFPTYHSLYVLSRHTMPSAASMWL
jgi:hypothetical protein